LPPSPAEPLVLLGGLTPAQFVRRHWQKRPLLIRGAIPEFRPLLTRAQLFKLATNAEVESRLIERRRERWNLEHGPFGAGRLQRTEPRNSTLLVQGVDLHNDAVHSLLTEFRFLPDARLDDVMVSWASDGGGVGPHFDSYDVFLLQAYGKRRWRIGRQADLSLEDGVPLKILRRFVPEEEHVLDPGDMLYLPPRWAHDGVAVGECMTYSIGFNAPRAGALAVELIARLAEQHTDERLYGDANGAATRHPARMPAALQAFAHTAVRALAANTEELACALGESASEPKAAVTFAANAGPWRRGAVVLDRRTRMLYDDRYVYINGDSYRAGGTDARLMRRLADDRSLSAAAVRSASRGAAALLGDWFRTGWLHRTPR
jgi:50S ribosomal protein L16 3-hydroxylase